MSDREQGRGVTRRDLFTLFRGGPRRAPEPPAPARPPVAAIDFELCLAYQGQPCDRCVAACVDAKAIPTDHHGHPRIDEYRCTGCGACEPVCPSYPQALTMTAR